DPPRQHPRNEWRQLSPRPKPGTKNRQSSPIRAPTLRAGNSGRATPSRRSPLAAQGGLLLRRPMADFCSAVDKPPKRFYWFKATDQVFWPDDRISVVVAFRLRPPSVDALVHMFKMVSHRDFA